MDLKGENNNEGSWVGMSKTFSHKAYVVDAIQMNEDFTITNIYGSLDGKSSDWVCTNQDGHQFILSDEYVKSHYVEVEKVESQRKFTYGDMAKGYAEGVNLEQEEDWSYIKRESSLDSNKPC
jgi:hypothetical protein